MTSYDQLNVRCEAELFLLSLLVVARPAGVNHLLLRLDGRVLYTSKASPQLQFHKVKNI